MHEATSEPWKCLLKGLHMVSTNRALSSSGANDRMWRVENCGAGAGEGHRRKGLIPGEQLILIFNDYISISIL